jgi:hypothetical protein
VKRYDEQVYSGSELDSTPTNSRPSHRSAGTSLREVTAAGEVLFEMMGSGGDGLRVVIGELYAPDAADLEARSWVRARIEVRAHPFSGTIETVYVPEDVAEWRRTPRSLREGETITVGGQRAPEVHLSRHGANVEIAVTPNGDDPQPLLTFLLFDSQP